MKTIIIIGAGASGMMAAITAKRSGVNVILLEHNLKIGKKILSTGNGRCNFTNLSQEPACYHSEFSIFPWQIIKRFSALDTIKFFNELGIYSKNKDGYMYPNSEQAASVLDALRWEIESLNIQIVTDICIKSIVYDSAGFKLLTTDNTYIGESLILACGGKAAPKTGSDGSGYDYATKLGHSLIPVLPALVQLRCQEEFYKHLSGIRVRAKVCLYADEHLLATDEGEVQLTGYGISGIPVFQVSRWATIALYDKKKVKATLDFMTDFKANELRDFLLKRQQDLSNRKLATYLIGLLPKKLGDVLMSCCKINQKELVKTLTANEIDKLVKVLKNFTTIIVDTNTFEQAQVSRGGINTEEVCETTLESKLVKGLYFAGEILDVDGCCGGYNLQWAWSSGYIAGSEAAK